MLFQFLRLLPKTIHYLLSHEGKLSPSIIRCTPAHLNVLGRAKIRGFLPTYLSASFKAASKVGNGFIPIPLAYPGSYAPTT